MTLYFSLLKVLVLSSQSHVSSLLKVLVSHFSDSRSLPLRPLPSSSVLSPPPPIPAPVLSESSSILFRHLPSSSSSQRKQRNDTKPSRRSWLWVVPKWNMILSLLVRPQSAVARPEHLEAVVSLRQVLPGLAANVLIHSNVKHAVIARPAESE